MAKLIVGCKLIRLTVSLTLVVSSKMEKSMYIGIDLGTSGVKVILMDEQQHIVTTLTKPLTVSRPHPLWSEQDPEQWWLSLIHI